MQSQNSRDHFGKIFKWFRDNVKKPLIVKEKISRFVKGKLFVLSFKLGTLLKF